MRFDLSDDTVLKVSGIGCLAYAVPNLVSPKTFNTVFFSETVPLSPPTNRCLGCAISTIGVTTLAVTSVEGNKEAKKAMLKGLGLSWLGVAAMTAYHTKTKAQTMEMGLFNTVGMSAMGGLCLWQGFRE